MADPSAAVGREEIFSNIARVGGALALAAIEAWRLSRAVPRLCDGDRPRVAAIAERLTAVLAQSGIILQEHTGEDYLDGMRLTVLATETRPEVPTGTVRIVETVKPPIYIAGELVLPGHVVLGRATAMPEERR